MESFPSYSLEELLDNPDFRRWVKDPKPQDQVYWSEWLRIHPHKHEIAEQAIMILSAIYTAQHTDISEEEVKYEIKEILARKSQINTSETIYTNLPEGDFGRFMNLVWVKVAAVFILTSGALMGLYYWQKSASTAISEITINVQNDTNTTKHAETNISNFPRLINLEDGSSVLLQKNSSITYSDLLKGEKRELQLKGDAFFEITKNVKRPFLVQTQGIVAKVLGTSFYIKSDAREQRVTILVKTGRVSVYPTLAAQTSNQIPDTILSSDQHLTYEMKNVKPEKIVINEKEINAITIPETHFTFNSTPLSEVFDAIEKAYRVNILYNKETFKDCTLTAKLEDESLVTKLELICKSLDMTYKIKDNDIEILGKGC